MGKSQVFRKDRPPRTMAVRANGMTKDERRRTEVERLNGAWPDAVTKDDDGRRTEVSIGSSPTASGPLPSAFCFLLSAPCPSRSIPVGLSTVHSHAPHSS